MEMTSLINIAFRALLILFAAVVLGLSVVINRHNSTEVAICNLTNDCRNNYYDFNNDYLKPMVHAFRYCIFVGAFGLLDAFVGIGAAVVGGMWVVGVVVDALAAVFYVAGGARLAAFLAKPYACEFVKFDQFGDQCTKIKADSAFLFLGFIAVLVTLVLGFIGGRKSGGRASFV